MDTLHRLTRKTGVLLCVIGITVFLLNFITYSLWGIDIDILGVMMFILGLVIVVAYGKSMKHSPGFFTRKTGARICIIAVVMTALLAYSPFPTVNGDAAGFVGLGIFLSGIILIGLRWKY